ncbi:MAG: ATP-binding protein [Nitrospinales bacterium]
MSSELSINEPPVLPPTEEQIRKKRIRTQRIIAAVVFSLFGLTGLGVYILGQQTSTPLANTITVVALFNVILILLVVLLILITRNLVKLHNERKSKIIGSKFQTKLIVAFLTLVLIPSILLFFVASKLFSYSIGAWFSLQVEQSLRQSMEVAQDYYALLEKDVFLRSKKIEGFITKNKLYEKDKRNRLSRLLTQKIDEYQLGGVVLYDNDLKTVVSKTATALPANILQRNAADLIKKSVEGEKVSEIRKIGQHRYLMVMAPLTQTVKGKLSIWGYMVSLSQVPSHTVLKIENIRKIFEEYKKQSLLHLPVTANYYITFIMITLLILFSAIWLGFYMARGITIPIQQLAKGTRRIAEGDLNFKIKVQANDEIAMLVDSFNKMTDDLNESRKNFQSVHEDLKSTNIELDRRRNYMETLLENIGAGVISIDRKGRITTLNKAAEKILNIQNRDILGTSYKDAFDRAFHEPIRNMTRQMSESGAKGSLEKQIELMVGENHLTLLVNINVLQDTGKKYLGLVIVFEDLTQMIKAQKIAAWREVAQGIAHEIKNPLTPILLNTQRLRKKFQENKEDFARIFNESIGIITQEVEDMQELLEQFLRFSRLPAPNPQPVSLSKIIDNVSVLYKDHDKKMEIKTNYDPNLNLINIDPEQFRRLFINLFENARDAINGKGIIEISTRLNTQKKRVNIEFSDNGVGISSASRDKLFLPYYTTKKRGMGLGLAIVNRIVIDHNGAIQVRDNYPRGTVFSIELPYSPVYPKPGRDRSESKKHLDASDLNNYLKKGKTTGGAYGAKGQGW